MEFNTDTADIIKDNEPLLGQITFDELIAEIRMN